MLSLRLLRVLVSALALLSSLTSLAFAAAPKAIPNELIVRYKPSTGDSKRAAALSRVPNAARVRDLGIIDGALVRFSGTSTAKAISALRNDPNVLYAEPNYEVHADRVPNDPRFTELYAMRNTGQTGGTPGADIRATLAWDLFTGDPNLKVGVIDTGVDYNHSDLSANIWTNPGEIPGNGIDDDHNGYVDDVHGYDFSNHDSDPMDDHGHGTHVSGTIAATGDNAIGVVGVNWRLKIVGIKFLNAGGSGSTAGAIEAVQYAIAAGVRLTSNSWGGGAFSAALLDAIDAAGAAGQLFVAAAGNASTNTDISPTYPADYDSPYIISVGASDHTDHLAFFSNFGVNSVDLAAPGVDILSTWTGGGYNTISGTSMATPHVSGVVALAAGRFPSATNLILKELVLSSCDSVPALNGLIHGARRLNAFKTILLPDSLPPDPVADLAVGEIGSTAIGLTWTATGDDGITGNATAYDLRYSTTPIDTGNFAFATRVPTGTPGAPGTAESIDVTGLAYNTNYFFAIKVLDELGNASALSNLVNAATVGIPQMAVAPPSLSDDLLTGDVRVQRLTVSNVGSGRLDFTVPTPEQLVSGGGLMAAAMGRTEPDSPPEKGAPDTRPGYVGGRGPDAAGYRWRSSDDPSGLAFQWIDVTANGTAVRFTRDDELSAPVSLGFEMPFYGRRFSDVRIGSNGYLTFTGTSAWTANSPLPTNDVPADIVAPWWCDLGLGGPRSVLYRQDGDRFIVSYLEVPSLGSDGTKRSFQVILEKNGRVRFQYLTLGTTSQAATIGIQAPTHETGLLVSFNAPYAHSGQAIEFVPLAQWLSVSPTSGQVPAGGSVQLDVTLDASGLFGGDYSGAVLLASNAPTDSARIPVSLHVTGAPDIALSRDTIDFGSLFIGATRVDSVRVTNAGTDMLHVTSVSASPAVFTAPGAPFTLAPGQSLTLPVSFTPVAALPYTGTLTLESDDHDEPSVSVALSGVGLVPPDISASPSLISADLFTGGNTDRTVTIENTGLSDLVWKIGARRPSTSAVAPPVSPPPALRGPSPNDTDPSPGEPVVHAIYSGTHLSFGISARGEILPYEYPLGNEHLARGTFLSGYTVAYYGAGIDRLAFAVYYNSANIVPVSYQEVENTASRVVVKVVVNTADGFLSIERLFTFRRDQKYVTVDTRLQNISGLPLDQVVFKEDADWDCDGQFGNTWDYDRTRNLIHASSTHFVGIASEQAPALMDLNGWNDYARRETTVELPVGPVTNFDGLEVLHFELGSIAPSADAALRFAYGAGNTLAELQDLMDEAVGSPTWLRFTPTEGVIPAGGSLAVNAHFDATGLNGGTYHADVHVTSNDPDEGDVLLGAVLQVTGAASLIVEPDSLYFGQPFAGTSHDDTVTVRNGGTDDLNITAIGTRAPYSTPDLPGTLAPGESRRIAVHYAPTVRGEYRSSLDLTSNDPYRPVLHVPLLGYARIPPDIAVAPTDVSADLLTGDTATQTITITNSDAQELFWAVSIGTPTVVATGPVFGPSAPSPDKTPRTEPPAPPPPGDIFTQDNGPVAHVPSIHVPGYVVQDGTLEQALANLDAGAAELSAAIPGRYDFSEGETGNNIGDGGNDMYDNGNFLGTEFGGLLYSNGVIVNSGAFGTGGRYFTRKYQGLFVLVADQSNVNSFTISGNLGADGGGNVDGSVLQLLSAGVTYRAFVKRVYNAFDPSVNHMVIVADAPLATHSFSTNTNDDFHQVTGLVATHRVYYLLYAGADGRYIDDVAALEILKTFVRVLKPIGPWLTVEPSSGVLTPGGQAALTARFQAAGLNTGDYYSDIHVESDDPDEPDLVTRAHLHVTGAPDIAVSADSLEFGTLYVGAVRRDTVEVTNDGTDLLQISDVSITPSHFHANTTPFDLAPGASRPIVVTFAPTVDGDFPGSLAFTSNDHDEPVQTVFLHGVALVAPDITVSPDSLVAELFSDDTTRTNLHLGNIGGSPLVFQIDPQFQDSAGTVAPTAAALAALLPPAEAPPWSGGSHSDVAYSRTGAAPVVRASVTGARVLLISTTDVYQSIERALLELGQPYDYVFTSNFAAVPMAAYNTIIVAMDGGTPNPPDVLALANAASAGKTVILFGGTAYPPYYDGMQAYLLHHTGAMGWATSPVPHFTLTNPFDPLARLLPASYNFQNSFASYYMLRVNDADAQIVARNGVNDPVLLHKPIGPGSLVYFLDSPYSYYWTQPADYAFLRQVVQNTLEGTRWLTFLPKNGVVPAGAEADVVARFDATRLLGGHYFATVHVRSDDPDESDVALPAHLHVIGRPNIAVTPDSLNFGQLFVGATIQDTARVSNTGTDVLHVTNVAISPSHFHVPTAPFDLAPGASRDLVVVFSPTAPGVFDGTLEFTSDDPLEPVATVHLNGEGLVAPDIDIAPGAVVADLNTGDTLSTPFIIHNVGGSNLTFHVTARKPASPAPAFVGSPAAAGPVGPTRNTTDPTSGPPVVNGSYFGTNMSFGLTANGEIMPLQSPNGYEHLAWGTFLSGYTLAYREASGADHLAFSVYDGRVNLGAVSYQELENSPTRAVIDVQTRTLDGLIAVHRLFTFVKDKKYISVLTRLENLTGATLSDVVYKEDADWDVDGFFGNTWDYDFTRNMVVASSSLHHAAIAAEQPPSRMDINGWNDYNTRNTTIDYPSGPIPSFDGLEVLHFDLGTLGPASSKEVRVAYGVGNSRAELAAIMDEAVGLPPWLRLTNTDGVIPAGGEFAVTLRFDATGLAGGFYDADLHVTSNDPDEPEVLRLARLHVIGVPRIAWSPDSIAFGNLFLGASRTDTVVVTNLGSDILHVSSVAISPAAFQVPTTPFDLTLGETRRLPVTFAPTVVGSFGGSLVLTSDAANFPTATVVLAGAGLVPPIAGVTPSSLDFNMPEGGHQDRNLVISNTGGSDLAFTIGRPGGAALLRAAVQPEDIRTAKTLSVPDQLRTNGQASPKSASFAPKLATSSESGSDATNVLVIADGGTELDLVPLLTSAGFNVTQIGDDSIYDGTNPPLTGFKLVVLLDGPGVTSNMPAGGQTAIKDFVTAGGGMISTEWLSYEVSNGFYTILSPLIPLTWGTYGDGVFTWSVATSHPVTVGVNPSFNVTTSANLGSANSGTVLMTSAGGEPMLITKHVGSGDVVHFSCGGNYFGYRPFLVPDMARLFLNAADWLTGSNLLFPVPSAGNIAPGANQTVVVTANAGLLRAGTHARTLTVSTNDPLNAEITIPVNIVVTSAPDIAASPSSLSFGSRAVGTSVVDSVTISNPGSQTLHVTSVATAAPFSAPAAGFTLLAGGSRIIPVTFAPTALGPFVGSLVVTSDDPDEGTFTVPLGGTGGSTAALASITLDCTVGPGGSEARDFRISNPGGSPMAWRIELVSATGGTSSSATSSALSARGAGISRLTTGRVKPSEAEATDWLSVTPASGTLAAGVSATLTAHFDAKRLENGRFTAELRLVSDDVPEAEMTIPVGLSVETARAAPGSLDLALHGLVPNPPVRDVIVAFTLPDGDAARLELLDLAGRRVRGMDVGSLGAGRHSVSLGSLGSLRSGVYLVRLQHRGRTLVSKCVLMR